MVKTRLQNQIGTGITGGLACFWNIIRSNGLCGLYRGLLANLVGVTPEKAIKFSVNDYVRLGLAHHYGISNPDNLPSRLGLLAGGAAGFCQVVATNPMEMVKIQMQISSLSTPAIPSRLPSTVSIVRQLGICGIYRGTCATLCRDIPFSVIFFQSFASLKSLHTINGQAPIWWVFGSGVSAGIIGAILATPMDVVKTRLQAAYLDAKQCSAPRQSLLEMYAAIYRKEGFGAFFKGSLQRCMIVAPLFGISLLVYEMQQRWLKCR